MVNQNVTMIDLGSSVEILYRINKKDFSRRQVPLSSYDSAYNHYSKPRSQFGSSAGKTWSNLIDRTSELTGAAATVGTAYLIFSSLKFPITFLKPSDQLAIGVIITLIPLVSGVLTYSATQTTMEYCGNIASQTYEAIAGIFDKKKKK